MRMNKVQAPLHTQLDLTNVTLSKRGQNMKKYVYGHDSTHKKFKDRRNRSMVEVRTVVTSGQGSASFLW